MCETVYIVSTVYYLYNRFMIYNKFWCLVENDKGNWSPSYWTIITTSLTISTFVAFKDNDVFAWKKTSGSYILDIRRWLLRKLGAFTVVSFFLEKARFPYGHFFLDHTT